MHDKIFKNVSLKELTTIKAGGNARYYLEANTEEELKDIASFSKKEELPIFILGGGSDVLINDDGFNGLVIKYVGKELDFVEKDSGVSVTAGAGMIWDDLVKECVDRNFQGIECLSGIPGTVGAAPVQNIGAYGQEIKDSFLTLRAFDLDKNKTVEFTREDCKFEYRDSVFKSKKYWQKYIITSVSLRLRKGAKPKVSYESLINYLKESEVENPTLAQVRAAVIQIRSTKFEDYRKYPNAGSFFKNPIIDKNTLERLQKEYPDLPYYEYKDKFKCFAGWFIEQAGWKGKVLSNAKVSDKHALILLNPDSKAKAVDIKNLSDEISSDVYKKYGVMLENEVQFIGF